MKKTRMGQHFLTNKNVARKIIEAFLPVRGPILEIGPGRGVLTELLIQRQLPGPIFAVEKDQDLYSHLKDKFSRHIILFHQDILSSDLEKISPGQPVNILSNAPYYISGEILDWLIQQKDLVRTGMIMLQKEVVVKLLPHTRNASGDPRKIMFNLLYSAAKEFLVSPGSFSPPPSVQSAVFSFRAKQPIPHKWKLAEFYDFLKTCFFSRRKTLFNNLIKGYSPAIIDAIRPKYQPVLNRRAEELEASVFLDLFKSIESINST